MKWTELKITTASEAVEAISNIMMEVGASGVAIEDALDLTNFVEGDFGEMIDRENFEHITEGAIVMAYFPETTFLPELLPTIKEQISKLPEYGLAIGENKMEMTEVADDDWATAWKKYYHPVTISRYLTIVPNWEDYQAKNEQEKIIKLDPGMAFGTGTHPTTMVSLHALEIVLRGGETVLDVGTGSGVLSIASKHLGAEEVYAYDLDDVAVAAAQENMDLNPVAKDVKVSANDLLKGIEIEADVIVANILADIILRLIPDAFKLVKAGGKFIVSGIIADKKEEVLAALLAQGFKLDETLKQGDWYGIILSKPMPEE
ncbi:50S ribosomal protein L11 methyltransferase [Vagococcus intermedius]|uniref:Ribosomal protein L11 methyltransferase n=1 Tax=Vagococcus intermedius TaxID=2991418 RepID=A0AAF0I7R0_9ENTE|nr:50S ribosomal protein L11 methyltransferase [Vagococcus intermedius]WEG73216.1 50S ribosomal protein L11 methyltransferase [Vagococcus intermedius]WEG75301.1 50S ribosomal protein L11 methyltransferase [Vagococcus intermedius]